MGERGRVCAHRGARASTISIPADAVKPHIHAMAVCVPDPDAARVLLPGFLDSNRRGEDERFAFRRNGRLRP